MADGDALNDDPESGASDNPCATSNLQAFLERYGMLAIIVYGCISLSVFCAIYAALVFGADAGPVLRYFGFSEAASKGTTFVLAIALTKWSTSAPRERNALRSGIVDVALPCL